MHDRSDPKPSDISVPAQDVDLACDQFEAAWKRGQVPQIEDYLPASGPRKDRPSQRDLLIELVMIDLEYRWRSASEISESAEKSCSVIPARPRLADYLLAFPALGAIEELPDELIAEEYRARTLWGDRPSRAEYVSQFGSKRPGLAEALDEVDREIEDGAKAGRASGNAVATCPGVVHSLRIRCPHCHSPIEIVDRTPLAEVTCPSCSSSFRLVDDEGLLWRMENGETRLQQTIGQFQLLERLGTGAFGTVWKAHDTVLGRIVALKIPRHGRMGLMDVEKFLREARAAGQLRHPSIVTVHEVRHEADLTCIVSEYIDGTPLDKWLSRQSPTPREVAALCAKIADGLHYAHEQGVVHRDLKPSNILIDAQGEPHIMDFGLAKREMGEITMTWDGQILGTPAYMSPEQARGQGHTADRRSDVYSLGVVLFEMLTGECPFRGEVRILLRQVLEDEPPSVCRLNSHIPRDLEIICAKCLEKDPRRRYTTAAELADDLRHFLAREPIHARPVSRLERSWRWCRRQPVIASLSGTAAVLLIAVAAATTFGYWSMKALAERNRQIAKTTELQLGEAKYQRLVLQAESLRESRPNTSLAVAVEAIQCARNYQRLSNTEAVQVMIDCLCSNGGHPLSAHKGGVTSITTSPDNRWFATTGVNGEVRLWDLPQDDAGMNSAAWTLTGSTAIAVRFTPDGRWLVVGTRGGEVSCWDLSAPPPRSEPRVRRKFGSSLLSLEVSPDGRWLAACVAEEEDDPILGSAVFLSEISQEDPLHRVTRLRNGCGERAERLAFSCDGRWLAAADWESGACVWRLYRGKPPSNPMNLPTGGVCAVAFNASSTLLAAGGFDGITRVWPLMPQTQPATPRVLVAHDGPISTVRFSPGDRWLVTANEHPHASGVVRIWEVSGEDTRTGRREVEEERTFRPSMEVDAAGIPPALPSPLPESESSQFVTLPNPFLPGSEPTEHDCITIYAHRGAVKAVEFTPDRQWLITAGEDGAVKLWNLCSVVPTQVLSGSQAIQLRGHDGPVSAIAVSRDGRFLVSGDSRERVFLSRQQRWHGIFMHRDIQPGVIEVLPDTLPYCVRVWQLDRLPPTGLGLSLSRESLFTSVAAFSPQKRWLVVVSADPLPSNAKIEVCDSTPMRGVIYDPQLLEADVSTQFAEIYDLASLPPIRPVRKIALPDRRLSSQIRTFASRDLFADVSAAQRVAISRCGRFLALCKADNRLSLLDLHVGAGEGRVLNMQAGVLLIGFNTDSNWLLGIDFDGGHLVRWASQGTEPSVPIRLRLEGFSYCVQQAKESREVLFRGRVPQLAMISDDNRWLIGRRDQKTLVVWDLEEEGLLKPRSLQHGQALIPQAISVEGVALATAVEGNAVCLWDLSAQHLERNMRRLGRFKNRVKEVKLSPHHRWMVTAVEGETHGTLWDLAQENPTGLALAEGTTSLGALAFTPDEEALVVGAGDSLMVYRFQTETPIHGPLRLGPMLNMNALAPEEDPLISSPTMFTSPWPEQVASIAVSSNGRWIILDKPHGAWWKVCGRDVTVLPFRLEDLLANASALLPIPSAAKVGRPAPQF